MGGVSKITQYSKNQVVVDRKMSPSGDYLGET